MLRRTLEIKKDNKMNISKDEKKQVMGIGPKMMGGPIGAPLRDIDLIHSGLNGGDNGDFDESSVNEEGENVKSKHHSSLPEFL